MESRGHCPEVLAALAAEANRIAPVTLAGERRVPVLPALEHALPGGLQKGSVVGVGGPGARSLALALVAGALGGDGWAAMVGCSDICLAAAEATGVPLHRLVLVAQPERGTWSSVVGALVDAFDVVVVAPRGKVRTGDVRKLRTKARDRGTVLVDLSGAWPESHDLSLRITRQEWVGLGRGHGVLEARRVVVDVAGRRSANRSRPVELWLPGPDGAPAAGTLQLEGCDLGAGDVRRHAGADIDALDGRSSLVDGPVALPSAS